MGNKIVMMGASGAVGGKVVERLLELRDVQEINSLGRSKKDNLINPKVNQFSIHVTDPATYREFVVGNNTAICTLGIGQPSKVSKEEFVKIDKDAVLLFAKICKELGVEHFSLLSSVGIDSSSRSFYLKTKGELVEELESMNFTRLSIFQPSMIITPKNRYGFSQAILLVIWPIISPLLFGGMKKYRGIRVDQLGSAIANNVLQSSDSVEKLTWKDIVRLAQ